MATKKKTEDATSHTPEIVVVADYYHGPNGIVWSAEMSIGGHSPRAIASYGGPNARRRALAHARQLRAALRVVPA